MQYNLESVPVSTATVAVATTADPGLHFDNLRSLLCYLDYLTDTQIPIITGFDSQVLKESHIGKSVFLTEKYIKCSIPSPDLEFIFGSLDIEDYNAYLDPEFNFKHKICNNNNILSEVFYPNIHGDHYNPFIRWNSTAAACCRSCSKLLDLAGIEIVDINDSYVHDNIFLDLVLTFPEIVDFYMFNPICRNRAPHKVGKNGKVHKSRLEVQQLHFIDRMNRCNEIFFKELHNFCNIPAGNILGMSSNLHIWGSEIPVIPNCHFHNDIPFFSYTKKPIRDQLQLLELVHAFKNPEIVAAIDVKDPPKHGYIRSFGSMNNVIHFSKEVKLVQKFIVDQAIYDQLRIDLSNRLFKMFNFTQCSWADPKYPIDIDKLKNLWSDIVYNEFQDIMDHWELLDVHVQWIPYYNKSKLLHALQYKSRPPVLDLDLFFKKCPGVVSYYDSVDPDKILDYLNKQLEIAISCSNTADIDRYESILKKAEKILNSFGPDDLLQWLQFLSIWSNDTRVFGFWRNIKRYMLDPEHELLIEQHVCPICGGSIVDTGIKSRSCIVDFVILRSKSKFLIYNIKKGPPNP